MCTECTSRAETENDPIFVECKERRHEIIEVLNEGEKSRKVPLVQYQQELEQKRTNLKETIEENFPNRYSILETILSVKVQSKIAGITQPFALILMGDPSSHKSTLLYVVSKLHDCYQSDSFTPKSFVSHAANIKKEKLTQVDLLPKIKHKTLITPELAPLFAADPDKQLEMFGVLIKVLDGKGLKTDSGVQGQRGYEGDYYFNWIGAVVEIPHRVWRILGNLGPKMYFLRIPSEETTTKQRQEKLLKDLKGKAYDKKLDEAIKTAQEFWGIIDKFSDQVEGKIVWNNLLDSQEVLEKITLMADILAKLRATVPTWHTQDSNGSNYNYETPVIENPARAAQALYNLAKGHAVLYGRNYITQGDLRPVLEVALSSAPRERVTLFRLLIENNGQINTNQFEEKAKVSKDTALKNMRLASFLGLADITDEETATKHVTAIKLKSDYRWCLEDEFRSILEGKTTNTEVNLLDFPPS
jgi:hypothetical protein